jgi:hypothetical protein
MRPDDYYDSLNLAVKAAADEQAKFQAAQAAAKAAVPAAPREFVTVKPGDTFSAIAKANGMTVKELLAINPTIDNNAKYQNGSMIFSGTKIYTEPATPKTPAPAAKNPEDARQAAIDNAANTSTSTSTSTSTATNTSTSTSTSTSGPTFVNPVTAATGAVTDQIQSILDQIAAMKDTTPAPAKPTVAYEKTIRKTGGVVQVWQVMSDGTMGAMVDSYTDFGAKDSVLKMFENTGLGTTFIASLNQAIDKVYEENIMPTDSQIMNSIYDSEAYKTRFAANETIAKRMKDGKGRPGDRLLTPYEYIQAEKGYEVILREAGLPSGFYDTQDDFRRLIENSVSVSELTDRVNIARNALQNADSQTKQSLKDYYGWTEGELTAYLLDSEKAFDIVNSKFKYTTEEAKQMYGAAEIGGAALRAGQLSDKAFSEEIYKAGKGAQAESAFQAAATQQADYQRLTSLYGEAGGTQDIAREELALAGGADVTVKKKRLASKERAMFAQKSALDTTSLGRRAKKADV